MALRVTSLSSFASNYIKLFPSEIDNQIIATCNLVGIQQYGFV
jgi:hypothetical protein